ncbi:hypothetical protein JHK86_012447 [Glycine max]|nr:hypothetical protein JHK86_012447 [Glycine max]
MAVDLMTTGCSRNDNINSFTTKAEENAVQEAASGLESIEKLIRLLSQTQTQTRHQINNNSSNEIAIAMDCKVVADVAVSKFKKVISLLGRTRTGHARFRRAPLPNQNQHTQPPSEPPVFHATPLHQIPPPSLHQIPKTERNLNDSSSSKTIHFLIPLRRYLLHLLPHRRRRRRQTTTFLVAARGGGDDDALSDHEPLARVVRGEASAFDFLFKRKCSSENLGSGKCGSSSSRCHCSKKSRKMRLKRVVRVPAISLKMADIPPDDYSWRKYGQKPIKGSPHPSSVRGCPARKHVERALDDPAMLVVTYEGEHNHTLSAADATNLILESS